MGVHPLTLLPVAWLRVHLDVDLRLQTCITRHICLLKVARFQLRLSATSLSPCQHLLLLQVDYNLFCQRKATLSPLFRRVAFPVILFCQDIEKVQVT